VEAAAVTSAHHIIEDYFRRTGQPRGSSLDGVYQYELAVLREMLTRLEVILTDEGVAPETVERVIRCMLYGTPSPADAELRMRQQERMVEMQRLMPPMPINVSGLPWMPPQ
jgi:hypothetical protein